MSAVQSVLRCGGITLDTETRTLSGERGGLRLTPQLFGVAERLMRRPGVIVEHSGLIEAMYAHDPDREPDNSDVMLRTRIKELRSLMAVLGNSARVSSEPGIGYSVQGRV